MWFYDIINVIVAIAVIVAILYLLFRLFVLKQGNERVILLPKRKTSFQLADMNMSSMTLFCDGVKVDAWAMDIDRPRHDGYFEAIIIKPRKGGTIRVYVTLTGRNGNIREDIKGFPYIDIDIYYQIVGRTDYHIDKQRIRLTAEEVQAALVH